jgi:hypothetical protein
MSEPVVMKYGMHVMAAEPISTAYFKNLPPPTNYYSIKPYSNPSGPMIYNSGALLPPPT